MRGRLPPECTGSACRCVEADAFASVPVGSPDAAERIVQPETALQIGSIQALGNFIHSRSIPVKIASTILGLLLALIGIVWILQGLNVLPGSFMTGQIQWAAYGAIALVIGGVMLYVGRRGGRKVGAKR